MRPKVKRLILIAPLALVGLALFITIGGSVVMFLWNWLLPTLFGWHPLTFLQALALLALCRILFGGHGFLGAGHAGMRRRMHDRWDAMNPDERERFRQHVRERWGFGPSTGEPESK